ncbi:unnamed protein product [Ranitomeya imitator]|uniref:Phosphatase and actin regulator n=1 Tax=Ranitomeya imitator TaxID=111125 RepID=A0ABN9LW17_9NEOB|nr:unnamed protein product [Ranitomeya imitator]
MHILQESSAEGSAQAAQMKLKRARLADDLNERIALRPGPLELVEKNIIPLESTVKEVMKGNSANYSKPVDAFAFEEDSSNDESPDQERSNDSQGTSSSSLRKRPKIWMTIVLQTLVQHRAPSSMDNTV